MKMPRSNGPHPKQERAQAARGHESKAKTDGYPHPGKDDALTHHQEHHVLRLGAEAAMERGHRARKPLTFPAMVSGRSRTSETNRVHNAQSRDRKIKLCGLKLPVIGQRPRPDLTRR